MSCELCGQDIGDTIVYLPLKKADGSLTTVACLKCAKSSPAFCKKHEKPHLGFVDHTTACIDCIEEIVAENRHQETHIFNTLVEKFPKEEYERILEWANILSSITHDSIKTCMLRAIATRAKRSNQSITEVLEEIVENKSVEHILPLDVYP